jgi:hypothetical protein
MARPPTTAGRPGQGHDRPRPAAGPGPAAGTVAARPRPDTSVVLAERPIDGLTDLWLTELPGGGVASRHDPGTRLTARSLFHLVRRGGGGDVRVMLPHGARHRNLFRELAALLRRDVLITPADAELATWPPGEAGGPSDTIPIDQATGLATDWLVVHPPGPDGALPAWYELAGGLVRPRSGLVALPLPGGVALGTRTDFVARRDAAARLLAGHPGLVTIAVTTRDGGFLTGTYSGAQNIYSGHRLAEALGDLPSWGGDIRAWLTWPADPALQRRLRANLVEIADTMGATVWAPPPGGSVEFIDACADLGAVDRDGRLARWQQHSPSGETDRPQFESDADGRLVPVGGPVAGSYPGVALVSVVRQREAAMADRYSRLDGPTGLFIVDLAVLRDGRLAAVRADDTLLALGPNECRMLLAAAGWWDEDVVLLSPADPQMFVEAQFAGLGVDVWALPPGASIEVVDGQPVALGPDRSPVEWRRLRPTGGPPRPARWRSRSGRLVPAAGRRPTPPEVPIRHPPATAPLSPGPIAAPRPPASPNRSPVARPSLRPAAPDLPAGRPRPLSQPVELDHREEAGPTVTGRPVRGVRPAWPSEPAPARPAPPTARATARAAAAPRSAPPGAAPRPDPEGAPNPWTVLNEDPAPEPGVADPPASSLPVLPRPGTAAARRERLRGIPWLPPRPPVNTEPFELYVRTDGPPAAASADGVPSPDLFLLGELVPPAPRLDAPPGHLLRVRVGRGAAVDLAAADQHVPPTLYLSFAGRDVFLLPAGRLDRVRVLEGYALDQSGEPVPLDVPGTGAVRLRCAGAPHGVDNLPGDAPRWPDKGPATAYALFPPAVWADSGGLGLYRRRPPVRRGHRLLELRIERGDAINVRACARELAPLRLVRPTAAELRAVRIDLVLPPRHFDRATVTQVLAARRRRWRPVAARASRPLSDLLNDQEPEGQRAVPEPTGQYRALRAR